MEVIRSLQNQKVKDAVKLQQKKYRDAQQSFLIENEHLIEEAYQKGIIQKIFCDENHPCKYDVETIYVNSEVLEKLRSLNSIPKMVAVCSYYALELSHHRRLFILDHLQDPSNVGAIVRSAYAFGFDGVIFSNTSVDFYNMKYMNASQGACFHMPCIKCDLIEEIEKLKANGVSVYGTSLENGIELKQFDPSIEKVALVMGNEGSGVTKEILDICDKNIYIGMKQFESLNVAIASGIVGYYFQ